ncbi:urease isoform X2 [Cinnamomum micranthum f. kanehirae]|uniref:Urease isoform X2 n=1 Tax=Cinnamomum micranthum f. kanehirae TaxID=337451 RepID=A0A3S3Q7J2_9MAGN|nr:urease isoform X2 [Cinnamomum micranthum f. kanehirae]
MKYEATEVEGTFPNGTKLVTIHDAIALEDGNLELALYGSFLPEADNHYKFQRWALMKVLSSAVPSLDKFLRVEDDNFPGELIFGSGNIMINKGRKAVKIKVVNKADRPIQSVLESV